jgi:hypothetical protein
MPAYPNNQEDKTISDFTTIKRCVSQSTKGTKKGVFSKIDGENTETNKQGVRTIDDVKIEQNNTIITELLFNDLF